MNVSEIKSLTARSVLLDVVLNYGITYKEVEAHCNIKKKARGDAVNVLIGLGLITKIEYVGDRQVHLGATLPTPITAATIWELCVQAQEVEGTTENEKVSIGFSAIEEVFPRKSYPGKMPTHADVRRWLRSVNWNLIRFYEIIEDAKGRKIRQGPINYVDRMISGQAIVGTSAVAHRIQTKEKIADVLESKAKLAV